MKESLVCLLICLILTTVSVHTQSFGSPVADLTWFLAVFSLIAVPVAAVRYIHPRDETTAGITVDRSVRKLLRGLITPALLIIPVTLGNHFVRTFIQGLHFRFSWANYDRTDSPFLYILLIQLLCVALPEEFFYRGYLQTSFLNYFKNRPNLNRHAPALAILFASLCFALAHLTEGDPARLLTFFPGILFGFLRHRTDGLVAPILCHAACNLMMTALNVHYF